MLRIAHATLTVDTKSIDLGRRTFRGVLSTPTPDRAKDIFEPLGATFPAEIPLLLHHDRTKPVGVMRLDPPTPAGLTFEATIPEVLEPGVVKDRTDEAWHSITAIPPLIRGLSPGFRVLKATPLENGGLRLKHTEICEGSLVTIPMNAEATITAIKAADLAVSGLNYPRVRGVPVNEARPMRQTVPDQIRAFENTRKTKDDARLALMNDAADQGVTLDEEQTKAYDELTRELEAIDAHLGRLRVLEEQNRAAAVPVVAPATNVLTTRTAAPVITVKANVEPGVGFVRFAQALMCTKGNRSEAWEYAKRWDDSTPEVSLALKAAVAAGTTTDATWAGPLSPLRPLQNQFLELLRPATILGKIPGFRQVPFNISVPIQTGGGTYKWVGQAAPKQVTKIPFGTITLGTTKCAGIIVITDELARNSTPAAESVIRGDMVAGIAQFLDIQFTDPTQAPVAGVSPGSITNGVTPLTSAGTTPANARSDIQALLNAMTAANISVSNAVLIMSQTNAAALGAALNPLGQPLFPALGVNGGTAMGISVIASQSAGNNVILIEPSTVLYADDGGVTIDASTEASVQMDDAPDNPATATTVLTSLWQNNLVGLRAERYVNWKRARTGGVQYTVQGYLA